MQASFYYNEKENTVAYATERLLVPAAGPDCPAPFPARRPLEHTIIAGDPARPGRPRHRNQFMQNDVTLLQSTALFSGLSEEDLTGLLARIGAARRSYNRGAVLVQAGAPSHSVGVILSGRIEAVRRAPDGSPLPITRMGPGGIFGDVLGGSSLYSPVTVTAVTPCEVLLIPYERLLCPDGTAAGQQVLQNLVRTISDKYFLLARRVDLLLLRSLRAKVSAYLLSEADRAGQLTFRIPFTRAQLADYLNCDRSALSRELGRMQREGLLDTYRSSFKLRDPDALRRLSQ